MFSKLVRFYLGMERVPDSFGADKLSTDAIEEIVQEWLKDENYQHEHILSQNITVYKLMQAFVGMATGKEKVSLDFCIGQVWRHCQPSIYDQLSYNECSDEVFVEIIGLDERMKRYAYGPPVESIQQMMALNSAGVMTFDFVNDPEIDLSSKGWLLKSKEESINVDLMINSVLDPPQIKAVNSAIVKNLLSNDLIRAIHDDFGVQTDRNGFLISEKVDQKTPITLLGRLAKGTIIGVDAILECFGSRPTDWAREAANRHVDRVEPKINA